MSLDDKLKEILQYYYPHDYSEGSPDDVEAVQKIKQAFAEEGYVQAHTLPKGIYSATGKSLVQISADDPMLRATLHEWDEQGAKYIKIDGNTYYRGQEWYDRFWQIYNEDRNPQLADSSIVREQVDKIAKRAAGIA